MPVIPALRRLRQEDHEFKGQPGLYSKTVSQKKKKTKELPSPFVHSPSLSFREYLSKPKVITPFL
jgi:hypothetical protein